MTAVAYCIQPKLKGDERANQKVNAYNNEKMRKALHYSYGYQDTMREQRHTLTAWICRSITMIITADMHCAISC